MKNTINTRLVIIWLIFTASFIRAQITTPITGGVLKTDLNSAGYQIDSVGRIGFGTATPTSRISILPAGTPTTNADGLQLGPDVYVFRSASNTLTITGNVVVSGAFSAGNGAVTLSGTNAWTGINSFAGITTLNGSVSVGTSGLTFSGSGATNTRTALGLVIGTNVQAYSARLSEIAALNLSPAGFMYSNGVNWTSVTPATVKTAISLGTSDTPTFAGLTLSTTPLATTSGGIGLASVAANKLIYTSALNTFASTDLSSYARSNLLPAADASAAITALTLNSLTGALSGSILSPTLATNAVTSGSITASAVTTAKLADGAVTTVKIGATGVSANTYGSASSIPVITVNAQGQLTSVTTASVTALQAASSLDSGAHLTGTYGVPLIKDNVVTDAKMTATGVSAGTYGNATTIPQLTINATGRITSASGVTITALTSGASATGVMLGSTYANLQLAAGSVTGAKIADSTITTANIVDTTIATADIADSAITTAKINAQAVTSSKIANETITSTQLADGAVTTAKIAASAVTSAKMAADAVALGTTTTGNYVRTITGTNITVANSGNESADVTISIPQSVATSASPEFTGLRIYDNATITGFTSSAYGLHVNAGHPQSNATRIEPVLSKYDALQPFGTIQGAINAASDGDIIYIHRPTSASSFSNGHSYAENLTINKNLVFVTIGEVYIRGNHIITDVEDIRFHGMKWLQNVNSSPVFTINGGTERVVFDSEIYGTPTVLNALVKVSSTAISTVKFTKPIVINSNYVSGAPAVDTTASKSDTIVFDGGGGVVLDHSVTDAAIGFTAVRIRDGNFIKHTTSTVMAGLILVDNMTTTTSIKTDTDVNQALVMRGTTTSDNILDNTLGHPIDYDVGNSLAVQEKDYMQSGIASGIVFRPKVSGNLTLNVGLGLTPAGLTDVAAGDQVELLLQFSSDGAVWTTMAVLDSYSISVAGGGPTFSLTGAYTTRVSHLGWSGTGGYRIAVRCNTPLGVGVNGAYVVSADATRTYLNMVIRRH